MSKKVDSIKGEEVDFDLFEIKAQIGNTEKNADVLMREKYIDIKRRRKNRKTISELLADQAKNKRMVSKSLNDQKTKKSEVDNDSAGKSPPKKATSNTEDTKKTDNKKRKIR